MPNDRQLLAGIGIAQGLDGAIKNFYAIRQAKQNLREDEEMFGIKKKVAENTLALQEQQLDPDDFQQKKKQLRLETQNAQLTLKANKLANKKAEQDTQKEAFGYAFAADQFQKMAQGKPADPGFEFDFGGGVKYKAPGQESEKTQSEIMKNRVETARKMASDQFGVVDVAKANQYMADMQGSLGKASGGGDMVNMKAPDGSIRPVPRGRVDYYKQKGAQVA